VYAGDEAAVKALLDAGTIKGTEQYTNNFVHTPLSLAISRKKSPVVRVLLEAGVSPDEMCHWSGSHKWTPLAYAADCNNAEAVAVLLEHGADKSREFVHAGKTTTVAEFCASKGKTAIADQLK